jgi:imidazolonepropionase-like amidohydrolase
VLLCTFHSCCSDSVSPLWARVRRHRRIMSPLAVLQADLVNGGKLLGWDGQIGALESGYLADVIAVSGDPLQGIGTLQNVSFVMKGGVIYKK